MVRELEGEMAEPGKQKTDTEPPLTVAARTLGVAPAAGWALPAAAAQEQVLAITPSQLETWTLAGPAQSTALPSGGIPTG